MSTAPNLEPQIHLFSPSPSRRTAAAMPPATPATLPLPSVTATDWLDEWEQIDDPAEVAHILGRLRHAPRFEAYRRPELYELAYPGYAGDLDYYVEQGRHGKVLYLGVGTGRIFTPLAEVNPQALGVEYSPDMHALWQRRNPHLPSGRVVLGDALDPPFDDCSFDAVLAPYSFLQVVSGDSLPVLLRQAHRLLKPGGALLADIFSPYLIRFRQGGLETNARRISDKLNVAIYILYDHLIQRMTEMASIQVDASEQVLELHLQYYFPRELTAAVVASGFEPPVVTGGYCGEPFDPITNQVVVYRAVRPSAA